jgi:putative NADH-flavin reductase
MTNGTKRIAVFGATGGTGRQVVDQALNAGYEVTVLVRDHARIPNTNERLHVVVGDFTHQESVEAVVAGNDVVISALGTNAKGPISACTDGVRSIAAAMKSQGVRRLLVVSSHGAAESHDSSLYVLAVWATLGNKMRDKDNMEALIRSADVDWTIVRPPALSNGSRTGSYRTGTDIKISLLSKISRADVADFLLREAVNGDYIHQTPSIAA